jgi:hypothetical protein
MLKRGKAPGKELRNESIGVNRGSNTQEAETNSVVTEDSKLQQRKRFEPAVSESENQSQLKPVYIPSGISDNGNKTSLSNLNLHTSLYYQGLDWEQERRRKNQAEESRKIAKEMKDCTFNPKIIETKKGLRNTNLKFMERQQIWNLTKEEKIAKKKKDKEKESTKHCTFSPEVLPPPKWMILNNSLE